MGISGLLPFVKKACRQSEINEIRGSSVAVDVSCLLHRGLFGTVGSLVDGKDSKFYVFYCQKYVSALIELGCHVILVFDGRPLPSKKSTNDDRRQKRTENMRAGEILLSQGNKEAAIGKFQQAVSITPEVINNTIEFFRDKKNVDIVVSPYESDAQLAFLTQEGLADVVITEDSDLIAFGCSKIIFKWLGSSDLSSCLVYEKENLHKCFTGEMYSKFDFAKFRRLCILSGCDYLQQGLPGIGLQKALTFFAKTSQTNLRTLLPRVPSYLKMPKLKVTNQFIEDFIKAENTFLHQIVFDPRTRTQRPLNPYPLSFAEKENKPTVGENEEFVKISASAPEEDFSYAGTVVSAKAAIRLALGNPPNQQPLMDKFLLSSSVGEDSVWSDKFVSLRQRHILKEQEERKIAKECGAFVLHSSNSPNTNVRKRRLSENEKDDILCISPNEKIRVNVVRKRTSNAKRVKNEGADWSIDEMMKIYGEPSPDKSTNCSSMSEESQSSSKALTSPIPAGEASGSDEFTKIVEDDVNVSTSQSVLILKENTSLSSTSSMTSQISTRAPKRVLGKSFYFTGKPPISNPFRRPDIVPRKSFSEVVSEIPSDNSKLSLDGSSSKGASLSTLEGSSSASIRTTPKMIGMRTSGLRKSFSTAK